MSIYLGTSEPIAIYKGSQPISAVYVGENKVWPDKHVYTNHIKGTTTGATFIWINEATKLEVPAGDFDVEWTGGDITDLKFAFSGMADNTSRQTLFTKITLFDIDTSKCTNFLGFCNRCSNLESFDLSHMDMSSATTLETMWYNATAVSGIDLSEKSLDNVENFLGTFSYNSSDVILGTHDLSKVTTIKLMFEQCANQTSEIDLSSLSSACTNADRAFYNCQKATAIKLGDLSGLTAVSTMFYHCYALTDLTIAKLPDMNLTSWCLSDCSQLSHDSLLSVIDALPQTTSSRTITLGTTLIAKLTDEDKAAISAKGWTLS